MIKVSAYLYLIFACRHFRRCPKEQRSILIIAAGCADASTMLDLQLNYGFIDNPEAVSNARDLYREQMFVVLEKLFPKNHLFWKAAGRCREQRASSVVLPPSEEININVLAGQLQAMCCHYFLVLDAMHSATESQYQMAHSLLLQSSKWLLARNCAYLMHIPYNPTILNNKILRLVSPLKLDEYEQFVVRTAFVD